MDLPEGDVLLLRRPVQLHGDGDQAERDGALPNRSRHDRSLSGVGELANAQGAPASADQLGPLLWPEPHPVSYTHLDVYKRQRQGIRRRGVHQVEDAVVVAVLVDVDAEDRPEVLLSLIHI